MCGSDFYYVELVLGHSGVPVDGIRYLVKLGANNLQEAFNAAKWKKSKNQLAKLMQRQM